MKSPIGVITRKKTTPIAIGAKKEPKSIPNLNQIIFNGVSNLEFNNPKIRKINDMMTSQKLIESSLRRGHKPKPKNIAKKTRPKFLFELIFILDFPDISLYFVNIHHHNYSL